MTEAPLAFARSIRRLEIRQHPVGCEEGTLVGIVRRDRAGRMLSASRKDDDEAIAAQVLRVVGRSPGRPSFLRPGCRWRFGQSFRSRCPRDPDREQYRSSPCRYPGWPRSRRGVGAGLEEQRGARQRSRHLPGARRRNYNRVSLGGPAGCGWDCCSVSAVVSRSDEERRGHCPGPGEAQATRAIPISKRPRIAQP